MTWQNTVEYIVKETIKMKALDRGSLILIIVGALNWLLVGLFRFDLVAFLFGGETSFLSRLIYIIVGLSGVYAISLLFRSRQEATE